MPYGCSLEKTTIFRETLQKTDLKALEIENQLNSYKKFTFIRWHQLSSNDFFSHKLTETIPGKPVVLYDASVANYVAAIAA